MVIEARVDRQDAGAPVLRSLGDGRMLRTYPLLPQLDPQILVHHHGSAEGFRCLCGQAWRGAVALDEFVQLVVGGLLVAGGGEFLGLAELARNRICRRGFHRHGVGRGRRFGDAAIRFTFVQAAARLLAGEIPVLVVEVARPVVG